MANIFESAVEMDGIFAPSRGDKEEPGNYSGMQDGVNDGKENTGRWTQEEHDLFLQGLRLYNKQWKLIADMIKSRTVVQIRTHAQKYFQKLAKLKPGECLDDGFTESGLASLKSESDIASFGSNSPRTKRKSSHNSFKKAHSCSFGEETGHENFVVERDPSSLDDRDYYHNAGGVYIDVTPINSRTTTPFTENDSMEGTPLSKRSSNMNSSGSSHSGGVGTGGAFAGYSFSLNESHPSADGSHSALSMKIKVPVLPLKPNNSSPGSNGPASARQKKSSGSAVAGAPAGGGGTRPRRNTTSLPGSPRVRSANTATALLRAPTSVSARNGNSMKPSPLSVANRNAFDFSIDSFALGSIEMNGRVDMSMEEWFSVVESNDNHLHVKEQVGRSVSALAGPPMANGRFPNDVVGPMERPPNAVRSASWQPSTSNYVNNFGINYQQSQHHLHAQFNSGSSRSIPGRFEEGTMIGSTAVGEIPNHGERMQELDLAWLDDQQQNSVGARPHVHAGGKVVSTTPLNASERPHPTAAPVDRNGSEGFRSDNAYTSCEDSVSGSSGDETSSGLSVTTSLRVHSDSTSLTPHINKCTVAPSSFFADPNAAPLSEPIVPDSRIKEEFQAEANGQALILRNTPDEAFDPSCLLSSSKDTEDALQPSNERVYFDKYSAYNFQAPSESDLFPGFGACATQQKQLQRQHQTQRHHSQQQHQPQQQAQQYQTVPQPVCSEQLQCFQGPFNNYYATNSKRPTPQEYQQPMVPFPLQYVQQQFYNQAYRQEGSPSHHQFVMYADAHNGQQQHPLCPGSDVHSHQSYASGGIFPSAYTGPPTFLNGQHQQQQYHRNQQYSHSVGQPHQESAEKTDSFSNFSFASNCPHGNAPVFGLMSEIHNQQQLIHDMHQQKQLMRQQRLQQCRENNVGDDSVVNESESFTNRESHGEQDHQHLPYGACQPLEANGMDCSIGQCGGVPFSDDESIANMVMEALS